MSASKSTVEGGREMSAMKFLKMVMLHRKKLMMFSYFLTIVNANIVGFQIYTNNFELFGLSTWNLLMSIMTSIILSNHVQRKLEEYRQ